jgi:Txe/YoeB family toxin of toxin-antitoxin system
VSYEIVFSRQAQKDAQKLAKSNLKGHAAELLEILREDPYRSPPRYESLKGELQGCYSRRINIQHRLVYEVLEASKVVHVLRMWTHYA